MIDLGPALPALLDALTVADVGVVLMRFRDTPEKIYANAPAVRNLGWTSEEWVKSPVYQTVAVEDRERCAAVFARIAAGETPPPAFELRMIHKQGHVVRQLVARIEQLTRRIETLEKPPVEP